MDVSCFKKKLMSEKFLFFASQVFFVKIDFLVGSTKALSDLEKNHEDPYITLFFILIIDLQWVMSIDFIEASAYEKQGRATIACLAMKFRSYRRVKSRTPPTK